MDNYFVKLYGINVNDKVEKKNGLSYVSWPFAWAEVKKLYPDATYTIYENRDGWNYHTDGRTCWVKTGVTINGIEHIEMLPVMDFKNRSIPFENVTSFDVNKAIQRSLTKAVARHGLGLYIYAGEDLPEDDVTANAVKVPAVQIEHPKADKPATVTTQMISADDVERLKANAQYVYGEQWQEKLDSFLDKYHVSGGLENMSITVAEMIKMIMTKDLKAKKGAA